MRRSIKSTNSPRKAGWTPVSFYSVSFYFFLMAAASLVTCAPKEPRSLSSVPNEVGRRSTSERDRQIKNLTDENPTQVPKIWPTGSDSGSRPGLESAPTLVPEPVLRQMKKSVEILSSDRLNGRYTTSTSLLKAADWIESKYRDWHIKGIGGQYRQPFPLRFGARITGTHELRLMQLGRTTVVPVASFVPRVEGNPGVAQGHVVFVGYAAQSKNNEGERDYDDLAGVDLNGKIALLMAGTPNGISYRALYKEIQLRADSLKSKVEKTPKSQRARRIDRLHRKLRKELAELLTGHIATEQLSDKYWKLPDNPSSEVAVKALFDAIVEQIEAREGPKFDYFENRTLAKLTRLAARGAVAAILVKSPRKLLPSQSSKQEFPKLYDREVYRDPSRIPLLQLSWAEAKRRIVISGKKLSQLQDQIDAEWSPHSQSIPDLTIHLKSSIELGRTQVPNLAAWVPGSDLSDEIVVIGAHYDHIGDSKTGECRAVHVGSKIDDICNGADDNASGTAALLELARSIADHRIKPRRTMVFLHFAGEELGLLGSRALVNDPPFDLNRVVAMINIDMIGRLEDRSLTISGVSTSAQWMPLLDSIGTKGLSVLYDRAITSRSDHAAFYKRKTPVLFFFTGVHEDYHRATDEYAKIDFSGMHTISKLIADLVHRLAQGIPIGWREPKPGQGLEPHLPGDNPSTIEKHIVVQN